MMVRPHPKYSFRIAETELRFYKAKDIMPRDLMMRLDFRPSWMVSVQTGAEFKVYF